MGKRKTVVLDINVCKALQNQQDESFRKLMKEEKNRLLDMSVNDIAKHFFIAGHWRGTKETLIDEEYGKLARQIIEEIKKQESE